MNDTDTPAGKIDPRTFDLDGWITGVKTVTKTVPLYARGDLIDKIRQLQLEIEKAERQYPEDDEDRGIADADPVQVLIDEFNGLQAEFSASRQDFTFRVVREGDRAAILAAMRKDNIVQPKATATEEDKAAFEDEAAMRMTVRCCVEPQVSLDQMRAIRSAFGELQFSFLTAAWAEASADLPGDVAPLSRARSRTRTDDEH